MQLQKTSKNGHWNKNLCPFLVFSPPLGILASFNGFLYIFDFILFQNKNKNHHISIVLYGMDNVSTAVYFSTTVNKDIVMRSSEWQHRESNTRNSSNDPDTPPYPNISTRPTKPTLP